VSIERFFFQGPDKQTPPQILVAHFAGLCNQSGYECLEFMVCFQTFTTSMDQASRVVDPSPEEDSTVAPEAEVEEAAVSAATAAATFFCSQGLSFGVSLDSLGVPSARLSGI
jgi:hypothetical protein